MDLLLCKISPYLRHTMQSIVTKDGKNNCIVWDRSTVTQPTDIVMNQVTPVAQEAPVSCLPENTHPIKVAINMVHIWMTNPSMPILSPDLHGYKCLPPTVQLLLHCTHANRVFARKLVSPGTATARLLTNNLHKYSVPDTLPFEEKTIHW